MIKFLVSIIISDNNILKFVGKKIYNKRCSIFCKLIICKIYFLSINRERANQLKKERGIRRTRRRERELAAFTGANIDERSREIRSRR